jgi:hypothetical protein
VQCPVGVRSRLNIVSARIVVTGLRKLVNARVVVQLSSTDTCRAAEKLPAAVAARSSGELSD